MADTGNLKTENKSLINWLTLLGVAIIWGSSFILIKKGIEVYSPLQVAALRICISGLVLLPLAVKHLKKIDYKKDYKGILIVGWIGSAIPAFLFPLAQTQVASSLAAMLNTLVPMFTFLLGLFFFGTVFKLNKLIGVLIGLIGAFFLVFIGKSGGFEINPYAFLIILGGFFYATSTNTIKKYCQHIHPLGLTAAAFLSAFPVCFIYLLCSDFNGRLAMTGGPEALGFIVLLAVFGTALANVFFFAMTQRTTALFASTVTYMIPIVASFWGVLDGEIISWNHLLGLAFSLLGVYIVSRS